MERKIFPIFLVAILLFFQNCGEGMKSLNSAVGLSSQGIHSAAVTSSSEQVELLKNQGCMFDGLLFPASADYSNNVETLKRSNCRVLPRAIETWSNPPDFKLIEKNLREIKSSSNQDYIFGMFIAESISTKITYTDDSGQAFDFKAMCQSGSQGQWGADTCVPNTGNPEFQRYIYYIVEKAIKLGVTDILFGQLGFLDAGQNLPEILSHLRSMAQNLGAVITIGGQPNGIMSESYLRSFDYIITPSYVDDVTPAQIRNNQYSECKSGTNCQAIYFHPKLLAISNAVIAEIDWSSLDDDAHRFGKKSRADRQAYIRDLSQALKEKGVGFLLPFRIWYDGGIEQSCKGFNSWLYSASNDFECSDEDAWNAILSGGAVPDISTKESNPNPRDEVVVENQGLSDAQLREQVIAAYMNNMGRTLEEAMRDSNGVNYWVQKIKNGTSINSMIMSFQASNEFFVRQNYLQILKRKADPSGLLFFQQALDNGSMSRQDVINNLNHFCVNHINGECS